MAVLNGMHNPTGPHSRKRPGRVAFKRIRGVFISLVLCWGVLAAPPLVAQNREASEYDIKAAFLFNFAKFIEWPADGPWKEGDPFTICVVGRDPFGPVLDDTLAGKSIGTHKLAIRRIQPAESWKGCQIAFLNSSHDRLKPPVFMNAGRYGVLTVGESPGFADQGGMINFVKEEDRIRLQVNVDAADREGLKISSKLLSLARIVRGPMAKGRD